MPETIHTTPTAAAGQLTTIPETAEALTPGQAQNTDTAFSSWKLACSKGKAYAQLPDGMVPKSYAKTLPAVPWPVTWPTVWVWTPFL